jgi:nucleoside-diphosphate-sugar epimerase
LQRIIGTSLAPQYEDARAGDIRHSLADITRAEELLGYRPVVGLAEGLRQTVEWYRANE